MIKIYDCSNSEERPLHRGGGGPVTNDIMRCLRDAAPAYGAEFTADPTAADIIITNDVFPASVRNLGKPMVKRMCGPFCQREFLDRNEPLNEAARLADKVIFISNYSANQYLYMYGACGLKEWTVVRNWAEPGMYNDYHAKNQGYFALAAVATNWNREEKRFSDLMKFAEMFPEVDIMLIGTCDAEVPWNVTKMGYVKSPSFMAAYLNAAHGFINLSYRDAAPKVVAQAVNCGLPVLYADSGGSGEMAGWFGIPIHDDKSLGVSEEIPRLDPEDMADAFAEFRKKYPRLKARLDTFNRERAFKSMLDGYFSAIRSVASRN